MSLLAVSRPEGWVGDEEHRQRMDSDWRRRLQKEEVRSGPVVREMRGWVVGVAAAGYRAERHLGDNRSLALDFVVVEDCS